MNKIIKKSEGRGVLHVPRAPPSVSPSPVFQVLGSNFYTHTSGLSPEEAAALIFWQGS